MMNNFFKEVLVELRNITTIDLAIKSSNLLEKLFWTLIGITSAGFGCAVEKQPGIYHKVSKTAKWLSQQINRLDNPK